MTRFARGVKCGSPRPSLSNVANAATPTPERNRNCRRVVLRFMESILPPTARNLQRPFSGKPKAPASDTGAFGLPLNGVTSFLLVKIHVVDKPDHHLLPRLVAPAHGRFRVRVVRVLVRIVEVRGALDA